MRGGEVLLGHWEELKQGGGFPPWALGGAEGGVQSSALGSGRSLSRGGDFLLGHWEELKDGCRALPWALGGA